MDSLKYWIIVSGALHLLAVLFLYIAPWFKTDMTFDTAPIAVIYPDFIPTPPEEIDDPPTPEPQPSMVPIGPTKPPVKPTKTPTPKPDKPTATVTPSEPKATPTPAPPKPTRTPTPKKDLSKLAELIKDIKEDREHPPTPRPTTAANTPKPAATSVAQVNTQSGVTSPLGTPDGSGIATSGWVPSTFKGRIRAELAAALRQVAPAVTREWSTQVKFTLLQDGKLKNVEIVKPSGLASVDEACIKAVQIAKFPPLTGNYSGTELTITANLVIEPK